MEATLKVGDHLACFIIPGDLQRGDVVVFSPPLESEKHKDYIKRCIALPGDKFSIKNDAVYINDKKIDEPYTCNTPTVYDVYDHRIKKIDGIVPQGKIVVLGDNRTNSSDSRNFGYLDISAVKSRAGFIYWNTEEFLNGNFSRLGRVK